MKTKEQKKHRTNTTKSNMMSTMMKELVKKEWKKLGELLKRTVNVEEKKCYDWSKLWVSFCNPHTSIIMRDVEVGLELSDDIIYTLTENGRCQDTVESDYGFCKLDVMKPRWEYMTDNGFIIKEVIEFEFDNRVYVRLVLYQPPQYECPPTDMSRIEFAFGNITFGVSYIIPWCVWQQRRKEIESIFEPSEVIVWNPTNLCENDWENITTVAVQV